MVTEKQLWLKKEMTINHRGHFEFDGDCGTKRFVVELDPTVTPSVPPESAEAAILAMHRRIQEAARRKHAAGEAYPVYWPYSDRLRHYLIALTDFDLVEA